MFTIAANNEQLYTGKATGTIYAYRPVPHCYKTEIQSIVAKSASNVLKDHIGDPEGAKQAANISASVVMVERRAELLYLLLRLCLRNVTLPADVGSGSLEFEEAVIGGINTKMVTKPCIDSLLEAGPIAQELADLMDVIEKGINLSDEDKKKSAGDNVSNDVRIQEPVSDVQGFVQEVTEGQPAAMVG